MNTHTITTTYKSEGGTSTIKSESFSADMSINGEYEIPGNTTDAEIDINIDISALKGFAFGCSKKASTAADPNAGTFERLTVKLNSTGAGADDTFVITPTNGMGWSAGDADATPLPLGSDVTKLYVTNTGTATANFIVRVLQDSTPVI